MFNQMFMRMLTHNLGFPRIGAQRQLKKASEQYWAGAISRNELFFAAKKIRINQGKGLNHALRRNLRPQRSMQKELKIIRRPGRRLRRGRAGRRRARACGLVP